MTEFYSIKGIKHLDKVIVRDNDPRTIWHTWHAAIFDYYWCAHYFTTDGMRYNQCLPYNEETAKLIGTNNDYK